MQVLSNKDICQVSGVGNITVGTSNALSLAGSYSLGYSIGEYLNDLYSDYSEKHGGSGSLGIDIYDLFHPNESF